MRYSYLKWSEVPYAGEESPPRDPVTPLAGRWPLFFLKRDEEGYFSDPFGQRLRLPIRHPRLIHFEKELKVVQRTLENLTPTQEKIAIYYGTGVPTKQWTPVADRLIDTYNVTPTQAARIQAVLHGAINDTMVVVWDLKYEWNVARPNQYDQELETVLCTPRFPTYPSGHAAVSGCAEVILSYYFPAEKKKLERIAEEDAISRLLAGVHFPSDNSEGIELGRAIGHQIIKLLKREQDHDMRAIDQQYREDFDADIFAIDFEQFIPFDFSAECTSLIKSESKKLFENVNVPKPLLKKRK
ncbi:vanadium-dependent haloperoxidase [Bacillus sp. ISL-35]|uniref:vanadium-dependent haloperoxidase n=1 Tax=Bacillus sp. ISL-35 TaxID=2819122 RepID=UPI001BE8A9B3|nr:vanadium-dependent haloperoxidase [Bacillus sp. ISL-35]MBT2680564.1 vanadium-dependent haloperoxidase [Bacillus sp. ISL-35]MBT2704141.1 vanadium-dependent haloperoxidase [Chryseobacterium sp. ISL-80]